MPNRIIPYRSDLREKAKYLRNNSTLAEVLLWEEIKNRKLGFQFHRQVPLLNYIVDFYSHELLSAIEVDGDSHDKKVDYNHHREQDLKAYGVKFLRFQDIDVKRDIRYVVNEIYYWIEANKNQKSTE